MDGKYKVAGMKIKDYLIYKSILNNNTVHESQPWVSYTIENSSDDDLLNSGGYLPVNYETFASKIEVNGSEVTDLNINVNSINRIRIYYDKSLTEMSFKDTKIKTLDFIVTDNFTTMTDMFYGCSYLQSICTRLFNTSSVTSMENMFYNCSSLTSLDLSNFNTRNVTDMSYMFYNCSSLTSLDVSNWNTSSVTNMFSMFRECSSLTSLDLSNFNTRRVSNMRYMFQDCSSLKKLNLSGFNTFKIGNGVAWSVFNSCTEMLKGVPEIEDWGYDGTNYKYFFIGECEAAYEYNFPWLENCVMYRIVQHQAEYSNIWNTVDKYDSSNDVYPYLPYRYDTDENILGIRVLYDNGLYTEEDMDSCQVAYVNAIKIIYKDKDDVTSIKFKGTSSYPCLVSAITHMRGFKLKDMSYMFRGCSALSYVDNIFEWDTSSVTDMSYMFAYCNSYSSINPDMQVDLLSNHNELNFNNWDVSNVTDMSSMFDGWDSVTSLDLSNWNTSNVTDMRRMFYDCSNLTSLNLSKWNTSKVTYAASMFDGWDSVPEIKDWGYDGTNYTNWTLTESDTSYSGTFPWNTIYTITVYYVDEEGNNIYEPQYFDYIYNNTYDLTGRVEREIEGYEFVKVEGSLTGVITSSISINVVYKALYIEYTISAYNTTDKIDALGSPDTSWNYYRRYLPRKYSASGSEIKSFNIIVKMMDGTATTISYNGNNSPSSSILACDVSSIMIEYESGEWFSFYGYNNSTYTHRLTGFIVPPKITNKTTRINHMFRDCTLLTSLDVSNWDTSNVTYMYKVFETPNLTTLTGIENWNVSKMENMGSLFSDCGKLTLLDLSSWDTTNATSYSSMFSGLPSYCTVYIGDKWNPNMTEDETGFKGTFRTK